jgi:hypothetical protein
MSVLKAASQETLAEAFRSYAIQPETINDTPFEDLSDASITTPTLRITSAADNALCCVTIGTFYYLYNDSLIHAFGWSAFLCTIRFCNTFTVIFFK